MVYLTSAFFNLTACVFMYKWQLLVNKYEVYERDADVTFKENWFCCNGKTSNMMLVAFLNVTKLQLQHVTEAHNMWFIQSGLAVARCQVSFLHVLCTSYPAATKQNI